MLLRPLENLVSGAMRLQDDLAGFSRSLDVIDEAPELAGAAGTQPISPAKVRRWAALRAGGVRLSGSERARGDGARLRAPPGGDAGAGGSAGRRQDHGDQPRRALLRSDAGARPARRHRRARVQSFGLPSSDRPRRSGCDVVRGFGARQHRLRSAACGGRRDRGCGAQGQCARLHPPAAGRLRYPDR